MTVIKRDGRWTVDFWYEGKRYRKKSPIDTQRGAREYERLLLQRVMQGEQLKVVQELLGHANIEATMIYAHLSESRLKDAVAKLDEPAPRPAADGHYLVTRDRRNC